MQHSTTVLEFVEIGVEGCNFDIKSTNGTTIFAYLITGETSRIDQWVKLKKKGEKWNEPDEIWTPFCLVGIQTANHYTIGDWHWWEILIIDQRLFYKKNSGPSTVWPEPIWIKVSG